MAISHAASRAAAGSDPFIRHRWLPSLGLSTGVAMISDTQPAATVMPAAVVQGRQA